MRSGNSPRLGHRRRGPNRVSSPLMQDVSGFFAMPPESGSPSISFLDSSTLKPQRLDTTFPKSITQTIRFDPVTTFSYDAGSIAQPTTIGLGFSFIEPEPTVTAIQLASTMKGNKQEATHNKLVRRFSASFKDDESPSQLSTPTMSIYSPLMSPSAFSPIIPQKENNNSQPVTVVPLQDITVAFAVLAGLMLAVFSGWIWWRKRSEPRRVENRGGEEGNSSRNSDSSELASTPLPILLKDMPVIYGSLCDKPDKLDENIDSIHQRPNVSTPQCGRISLSTPPKMVRDRSGSDGSNSSSKLDQEFDIKPALLFSANGSDAKPESSQPIEKTAILKVRIAESVDLVNRDPFLVGAKIPSKAYVKWVNTSPPPPLQTISPSSSSSSSLSSATCTTPVLTVCHDSPSLKIASSRPNQQMSNLKFFGSALTSEMDEDDLEINDYWNSHFREKDEKESQGMISSTTEGKPNSVPQKPHAFINSYKRQSENLIRVPPPSIAEQDETEEDLMQSKIKDKTYQPLANRLSQMSDVSDCSSISSSAARQIQAMAGWQSQSSFLSSIDVIHDEEDLVDDDYDFGRRFYHLKGAYDFPDVYGFPAPPEFSFKGLPEIVITSAE